MDNSPAEPFARAWVKLTRAQAKVLAAIEAALKTEGHPPLGWYDVLLELSRTKEGTLRPLELETRVLLAQHNVSRLIDRMERDGLVKRLPYAADGRGQLIAITFKGRELQKKMWPIYRTAIQKHVGEKLTEAEAAKLANLLAKLQ